VIVRVTKDAGVGITGLGTHVPDRVLTNEEISQMVETSDEWIVARTGIHERRIADPEQATSDLAIPAAAQALAHAGVEADSVDLVLVATASPDMFFPATASLVATGLGATRAAAFDLSAGCSGFVYGLGAGYSAVASGLATRVLVVGADTLSRFVNWQDRSTCVLFGDGAGAVVIEKVGRGGFVGFELGSDGSRAGELTVPAGGSRTPATAGTVGGALHTIHMNGREVFRFAAGAIVASAERLLDACGIAVEEVDLYAVHQANRRIIDHAVERLGLDVGKVLLNIDRYGNTSSASIPLVLEEALETGRLEPGSTVLTTTVGAGLTWGSAVVCWSAPGRAAG
jgi:3-oxoacyl-[acyl-carrier-protein] synthase III